MSNFFYLFYTIERSCIFGFGVIMNKREQGIFLKPLPIGTTSINNRQRRFQNAVKDLLRESFFTKIISVKAPC